MRLRLFNISNFFVSKKSKHRNLNRYPYNLQRMKRDLNLKLKNYIFHIVINTFSRQIDSWRDDNRSEWKIKTSFPS